MSLESEVLTLVQSNSTNIHQMLFMSQVCVELRMKWVRQTMAKRWKTGNLLWRSSQGTVGAQGRRRGCLGERDEWDTVSCRYWVLVLVPFTCL